MLQRDHIMRQLVLLSQALARALELRRDGRTAEAITEIDAVLAEANLETLEITPSPGVGEVASLLVLRGDLLLEDGRVPRARADYEKALALYKNAIKSPDIGLPWDIHARIDTVLERLEDAGWVDE